MAAEIANSSLGNLRKIMRYMRLRKGMLFVAFFVQHLNRKAASKLKTRLDL